MSNRCTGALDDVTGDAGYADATRRGWASSPTPGLHRLQGLRGRLQGVERRPRGRLPAHRDVLRQHPGSSARAPGGTWRSSRSRSDADRPADLGLPGVGTAGACLPHGEDQAAASDDSGIRWLMSSDVCKHCTHAACLDVCPTGALFRTEFGTVVVQPDVCNGCGYCVPACPYGVIDQRKEDGRVFKCTLCYDRLKDGREPGLRAGLPDRVDPVRRARRAARARRPPASPSCTSKGVDVARLYGHDPDDGVGGDGAFFLLLDEPEVYGLPPDPVVTTRDLGSIWRHVGAAAATRGRRRRRSFVGTAPMRERDGDGARAGVRRPTTAGRSSRRPTWKTPDVPLYLFLGGAGRRLGGARRGRRADRTARPASGSRGSPPPAERRSARSPWSTTWAGPERFLNMLRVFKPTSPLSVGSWILAPFGALAAAAAASEVTGRLPRLGRLAGLGAAALGPAAGDVHRGPDRQHRRARLARGATASCRSSSPGQASTAAGGHGDDR